MRSLGEHWRALWNTMRQGETRLPARITIPRGHVDRGAELGEPFQPGAHYFQVRVNEMFLAYSRQWFSEYDPLVFVVSEFIYDKHVETLPYIVGPSMLEQFGQQLPSGMIFADTKVAGVHPYQGGALNLAVVLYRIKRNDYARALLKVVESAANALDFSTALSSYTKVAGTVLDGVESLLGLGDTVPLIGARFGKDIDAGDRLEPSFFVLIDAPEETVDVNQLWVRENTLCAGPSMATATPFRSADYVLYSIAQSSSRSEERTLPFYPLFEQVLQLANTTNAETWKSANAAMLTLALTIDTSPDLTTAQAQTLNEYYISEMKRVHNRATMLGSLGGAAQPADAPPPLDPEVETTLRATLQRLDL